MRPIIFIITTAFFFCFSAKAQNSISFKTGVRSNPDGFINPEAYLFLGNQWTSLENTNSIIPQFDFGFTLKKPESNWALDLGLNYQYIQVNTHVPFDEQSSNGGYSITYLELNYIASLNYFGIHLGSSYTIPFTNKKSQFTIPFGAQLLLPLSCKTLQEFGNDTYLFRRIFEGEDYSNGIYYGFYLRPTYSLKLTKDQNSPWRFGLYAETELLFPNERNRDPSFLAGGGIEIRYLLN